jgi:RsiW-degrading membrane proteinase PrsW (M82 family)
MTVHAPVEPRPASRRRNWLRIFVIGLVLWVLSAVVIYVTGNPNLIPTLVLLGSFLVPVTFVSWAFERRDSGEITAELVFRTFLVGGVLGVLGASVLEAYLLHPSPWLYLEVGVIEEAVKLAALALLTRRLAVKSMRDGMVLGGTVGFGFAAFESAGYALTALFTPQGLSLDNLVTTELLRSLLTPVGHGLWTAILGGILFSRSSRTHFVLTGRLIAAFVGVSILHALWDMMPNIAALITLLLTGQAWQYELLLHGWLVAPTDAQVRLYTVLSWGGLAVIGVIGLLWLYALVRLSRQDRAPASPRLAYRWPTTRSLSSLGQPR